jgi:hypothetical protein
MSTIKLDTPGDPALASSARSPRLALVPDLRRHELRIPHAYRHWRRVRLSSRPTFQRLPNRAKEIRP